MREGRITEILDAGVELPGGYRTIDGGGGLALPAFIDSCSTVGLTLPQPVEKQDAMSSLVGNVHIGMREANRKGLQPALEVVTVLNFAEKDFESYREQGFAVVHSNATGEILSGQSCVTTLSEAALRDRVVANRLFLAAGLSARGGGYPSTLMGYLSHLRQFILDAKWHALRQDRYSRGRLDRRPPLDAELDAIKNVLAKKQRLLCEANSAGDIRRWLNFAEAQDVKIAIQGGREAWKVAAELAEAGVPVLLGLDWGDEVEDPDAEEKKKAEEEEAATEEPESEEAAKEAETETTEDPPVEEVFEEGTQEEESSVDEQNETDDTDEEESWEYEEPIGLLRERRRIWEERRDCALRLNEAGVTFVFATSGQSPKDLLENSRELVEQGLPEDVALAALTSRSAVVLGIGRRLGKIEKGFDASLAIWSDSPFAKKASLEWLVVDGATFEFEREEDSGGAPAEGVDMTGEWEVVYSDQTGEPAVLELDMQEDGEIIGTLSFEGPGGEASSSEVTGSVSGHHVTLKGSIEMGQFSAKIRIEGDVEGDSFKGDATWKFSGGEDSNSFTAKRKPNWSHEGHSHGGPNR